MDEKTKAAFIAGAVALGISVSMVALILFLKGEPPVGGLPLNITCSATQDCGTPQCAECMECHLGQQRCVYKLKNMEGCKCVAGEVMPCGLKGGVPGIKVCTANSAGADWGTCNKI